MDSRCPECGAPLTEAQAESGNCPACMLQFGLEVEDDGPAGTPLPDPGADPETIGPFRVVRRLGEGGMGVVYLGRQLAPVRRDVAIKVVKRGTDTVTVLTRFAAERQALALMDHPSIARVYDAGETADGLPYFAMEYVEGEPITSFCERERLSLHERLELLIEVCRGVQHAHHKGVIHRDLKPSNVLVTRVDGVPTPKIIDFGVAKAIDQRLTERTLYTELGLIVGTPEYMSPEQAELTGERVDARTDVYALGVMQYQLLTGSLPFEPAELRAGGFDEICRRIREEEPAPPSIRVSSADRSAAEHAEQSNVDLPTLRRRLKGDIDWVTMRALEKDPERRYGSPQLLAEELQRLLDDEPVQAGPPGRAYRIGKFVRRHRLGVTAAAAVVLALAIGATLATIGFVRATESEALAHEEAETAREVSDLLIGLFQVSDPGEARGNSITAREILDRGAARIEDELVEQPRVQARMLQTIARVYRKLGLFDEAAALAERALEIRRREFGETHPETLQSLDESATLLQELGRYEEAEPRFREVLSARRRSLGDSAPLTVNAINNLALILQKQGKLDEAQPLYEEVVAADLAADNPGACITMSNVATLQAERGDFAEAENWSRRTLECHETYREPDHPDIPMGAAILAVMLQYNGKIEEAERYHRRALAGYEAVLEPGHPDLTWVRGNLGVCLRTQGKLDESIALLQQALAERRADLGDAHPETLHCRRNLADSLQQAARVAEAEVHYREHHDLAPQAFGENSWLSQHAAVLLGGALRRLERLDEAEPLIVQGRDGLIATLGAEHHRVGAATTELAQLREARGDWDEAERLHRAALANVEAALGPTHRATIDALIHLGRHCSSRDRAEEAERLLRDAVARASGAFAPEDPTRVAADAELAAHLAGLVE